MLIFISRINLATHVDTTTKKFLLHLIMLFHSDKIESFIDENKALMKRMYGYFEAENEYGSAFQQGNKRKRSIYSSDSNPPNLPELDDIYFPPGEGPNPIYDAGPSGDSYFSKLRNKRQSRNSSRGGNKGDTGR